MLVRGDQPFIISLDQDRAVARHRALENARRESGKSPMLVLGPDASSGYLLPARLGTLLDKGQDPIAHVSDGVDDARAALATQSEARISQEAQPVLVVDRILIHIADITMQPSADAPGENPAEFRFQHAEPTE